MQARLLCRPTSSVEAAPSAWLQLQAEPAGPQTHSPVKPLLLVLLVDVRERSEVVPGALISRRARDTRRRFTGLSPLPLNATSWIS